MKIKLVTAIYNNLKGTEFGGRQRAVHYNYSLLSLLKMSFAEFVCYTSESDVEILKYFFYRIHTIPKEQLVFKTFELEEITKKYGLNEYKNLDEIKVSERCFELQYAKYIWLKQEAEQVAFMSDTTKHKAYWIDAGLSHTGLIPNKYLNASRLSIMEQSTATYFESPLFNNTFLGNVIKHSNPLFFIEKDNVKEYYLKELDSKWYLKNKKRDHVPIGGLFGGEPLAVIDFCEKFEHMLIHVIKEDGILPTEEQIMTVTTDNMFPDTEGQRFDTWWHEGSNIQDVNPAEYFKENKSFYKVLEGLQ